MAVELVDSNSEQNGFREKDPAVSVASDIDISEKERLTLLERLMHESETVHTEETPPQVRYIYDKMQLLSEERSLEILRKALTDFDNDPNFDVDEFGKIQLLVEGREVYPEPESYDFDLRVEAAIIHYYSPYRQVRSMVNPYDNPDSPCETIRIYAMALFWTAVGSFVGQYFDSRTPLVRIPSTMVVILMWLQGKLFARCLPDWGITIKGRRVSLNPGPFAFKELIFGYLIYRSGGTYTTTSNFFVDIMPNFYGNDWARNPGYQYLLTFSTELIGIGIAGLFRRVLVYPVRMIYPTALPNIAIVKTLMEPGVKQKINGWSISREKFFWISFTIGFVWYWFPNYIANFIMYFNWTTWIAPENETLAAITGVVSGLGINPVPSLDWTDYFSGAALPFYTTMNSFLGTVLSVCVIIPATYYTNFYWTSYMHISIGTAQDNTKNDYNVTRILTNGTIDEEKYKSYSPPYYSAGELCSYGSFFALYPLLFINVTLTNWESVKYSILDIWKHIRSPKSDFYEDIDDPLTRMMTKYKEVPHWWFLVVLLISLVFGIIAVQCYPTQTPVWGIFFALAINFVFFPPIQILLATAGTTVGLNVLVELIVGYALPGNGTALNIIKCYGYMVDGRAGNYIETLKIGHYCQIPPRAQFRGLLIMITVQILIVVAMVNWQITTIPNFCVLYSKERFWCIGSRTFYTASVFWGVIGPKRVFGGLYPVLQYAFLIGAIVPFPNLVFRKFYPKLGLYFKPELILIGMIQSSLSGQITELYKGFIFMFLIFRYYPAWWEKYNYVLLSAIQGGSGISQFVQYWALQYHSLNLDWWGNDVSWVGMDGYGRFSLKELPEKGYFGLDPENYP